MPASSSTNPRRGSTRVSSGQPLSVAGTSVAGTSTAGPEAAGPDEAGPEVVGRGVQGAGVVGPDVVSAPVAGPPAGPLPATTTRDQEAVYRPATERVVSFRPRSVLTVLGVLMAVAALIGFVFLTSAGLTLIAIAVFLSLALNPAVEFFQRHRFPRALAVLSVFVLALGVIALLVTVLIPPMVIQVTNLVQAVPGFLNTLSEGNGPAGVLERRYQVVERIEAATTGKDFTTWTTAALSGLDVIRRVATSFVGAVLITFLTLFMLLEGPAWRLRLSNLLPEQNRASIERIGAGVYRAVGGFVAGNLLASLASGVVCTVLLLATGVPYALPLGLFVVFLALIPYIGPAVVTVLLTTVALTQGPVRALVVFCVLLGFHLIEGHTLRPLIYGKALKLSPLAVLISIVLGTELAGILGALAAIPVAGAIQVILKELLRQRTERSQGDTAAQSTT